MTVNIEFHNDCTQRELVVDIARLIYQSLGYRLPDNNILYLFKSQHPLEQNVLSVAEEIFELFSGDGPSYDDDDLNEELV